MALAYLFDPNKQFQAPNGVNNVAGFLRVYYEGTDDRATTFKNFIGTLNPADIPIDNNGRAVVIVEDEKTYRLEVYSSNGNMLWTQHPLCALVGGGGSFEQVQSNWAEEDPTSKAFIRNKPNLDNYLDKDGDGTNVTVTFSEDSERTNIATGEKLAVLFGKIKKWFTDLKAMAFKDKADMTQDVSGVLPIPNGGTGASTAESAANNLLAGLPIWSSSPSDSTRLIRRDLNDDPTFGQVTFLSIWNYLKSKMSSDSNVNVSGTSSTITETLPLTKGGTGGVNAGEARTNLDVYSKSETDALLNGKIVITQTLPVSGEEGKIYYVGPSGSGADRYEEYIWDDTNSTWIKTGERSLDLSNYLQKTGDGKDVTVTFTEALSRTNIASTESLSILFGKIKKFFSDLASVAFSGSYNDLNNTPDLTQYIPSSQKGAANGVGTLDTSSLQPFEQTYNGYFVENNVSSAKVVKIGRFKGSNELRDSGGASFSVVFRSTNQASGQALLWVQKGEYGKTDSVCRKVVLFNRPSSGGTGDTGTSVQFYKDDVLVDGVNYVDVYMSMQGYATARITPLWMNRDVAQLTFSSESVELPQTAVIIDDSWFVRAPGAGAGSKVTPAYVASDGTAKPCGDFTIDVNKLNSVTSLEEYLTADDVTNGYKDFSEIFDFAFWSDAVFLVVTLCSVKLISSGVDAGMNNATYEVYIGNANNPTRYLIRAITNTDLTDYDDRGLLINDIMSTGDRHPVWRCIHSGCALNIECDRVTVRVKWKSSSFGNTSNRISMVSNPVTITMPSDLSNWPINQQ